MTKLSEVTVRIAGMTCSGCERTLERAVSGIDGVARVDADAQIGTLRAAFCKTQVGIDAIHQAIEQAGYRVVRDSRSRTYDVGFAVCMLVIIGLLYFLLDRVGAFTFLTPSVLPDASMGYGMLFFVGFATSLHCVAMCGGINLSQILPDHEAAAPRGILAAAVPSLLYHAGRLISYTAVGAFLGFLGMLAGGGAGVSSFIQGILKVVAGTLMVVMGAGMLGIVPPRFRVRIPLPAGLAARIDRAKAKAHRPFFVGILNGFMPCGPLQSMQIVALASANPLVGAASLLVFGAGTTPLMLGLGSAVAYAGSKAALAVRRAGSVVVVVLGLAILSQGFALSGMAPLGFMGTKGGDQVQIDKAFASEGAQTVSSTLGSGTYPHIQVQAGVPVRWTIEAPAGSINGCNSTMLVQEYGIEHTFHEGTNLIEFTPEASGSFSYSCWMGMIHGTISVD